MMRARAGAGPGLLLAGYLLGGGPAVAQEEPEAPVVENVEVQGNQYLQRETLLFYVTTKPGDRYDERRLKDDFRRLWGTGCREDLALEVRDGQKGKIVLFNLGERKRIQIVDFRGSKELTNSNIEDELKKRDAQLRLDTFYDLAKARKVEAIIHEMLQEKGRPFATVKHDAKVVAGSGYQGSFIIDDRPQAKNKEIVFAGETVFSSRALKSHKK